VDETGRRISHDGGRPWQGYVSGDVDGTSHCTHMIIPLSFRSNALRHR
jgi:hypothetical protein